MSNKKNLSAERETKMKIACLTFHNSTNYGTVLQAYALQTICERLGFSYRIIDYSNPQKKKFDSLLKKNKEMSLFSYLFKLISFPISFYKKAKFLAFTKNYLKTTCPYNTSESLSELNRDYDAFLCGSDQIWNLDMVRFDSSYFLSFVNKDKKKVAYAASIGNIKNDTNYESIYKMYLPHFTKIAVREKSAATYLNAFSVVDVSVVLDPTLLLSKEDWCKIAVRPKQQEGYILVYVLSYDKKIVDFIKKLSSQTGLDVIYIYRNIGAMVREGAACIASPLEWLGLFKEASFVVTNSFHGTAFSVNFNKTFFSFTKGGANNAENSRLYDFLEMVGLQRRLNIKAIGNIDLAPPNYSHVNKIIMEKRLESINFLRDALLVKKGK